MNAFIVSLRYCVGTLLVCCLLYPCSVTGLAHLLFACQAGGSLLQDPSGNVVGSELIGQEFTGPGYFHPRPSAGNYDPMTSGGSNLGPTSRALTERIASDVRRCRDEAGRLPIDFVTMSGSGLDPHLSPASARVQVPRVAATRGISPSLLQEIVDRFTQGRELGILGEPRVTVLPLNMALDSRFGAPLARSGKGGTYE
ncbi:MAG TPA: potassium-transporting ATPase subunit KdpC [Candidatus Ozemobacteraceae bacterium]|nr:potassium-transporting ATPase subunit KdpC [Candidatus Ozemobacteraceae bacterium]